MEWKMIIALLYLFIMVILILSKNYSDDEEYVYTAAIPIGLPIFQSYDNTTIRSGHQDIIGVSIRLNKKNDEYTYSYDKRYTYRVDNARVVTEDDIVLLNMVPSDKKISGDLYLSTTDRKYIRRGKSYLTCNVDGSEITEPLTRIKIVPGPK